MHWPFYFDRIGDFNLTLHWRLSPGSNSITIHGISPAWKYTIILTLGCSDICHTHLSIITLNGHINRIGR